MDSRWFEICRRYKNADEELRANIYKSLKEKERKTFDEAWLKYQSMSQLPSERKVGNRKKIIGIIALIGLPFLLVKGCTYF